MCVCVSACACECACLCVSVCVCVCVFPPNVSMYKHSRIMPDWFNSSDDVFCNIPNTPDVVFLDKVKRRRPVVRERMRSETQTSECVCVCVCVCVCLKVYLCERSEERRGEKECRSR